MSYVSDVYFRYPPERYPVLAFKGAPAHFPVEQRNIRLQQYLVWSENMNKKAEDVVSSKLGNSKYIGLHLRLGSDFVRTLSNIVINFKKKKHKTKDT
jgi:peptide-O-fucosyltransferase